MDIITQAIEWFSKNFLLIIEIIGIAAAIATLTPNKSDDKIVQKVLDVVNFLGMNFGKSANDPNK